MYLIIRVFNFVSVAASKSPTYIGGCIFEQREIKKLLIVKE